MGILSSNGTVLKIIPLKRDFSNEDWIETLVEIEYHFDENETHTIIPKSKITLEYKEYQRLICGIKEFIDNLKERTRVNFSDPVKKFHFVPIETDIKLSYFGTMITPDKKSDITLRYMLNMGTMNSKFNFEFIGGEISIDLIQLLRFTSDLETALAELN